jgi:hypothetical protein
MKLSKRLVLTINTGNPISTAISSGRLVYRQNLIILTVLMPFLPYLEDLLMDLLCLLILPLAVDYISEVVRAGERAGMLEA